MKSTTDFSAMGLGSMFGGADPQAMLASLQKAQQSWLAAAVSGSNASNNAFTDLDKQIADLKAVQQWLTVNMNMLQASIQGLEVQRATLATLNELSKLNAEPQTATSSPDEPQKEVDPHSAAPPMWHLLQKQFQEIAQATLAASTSAMAPNSSEPDPDSSKKTKPEKPAANSKRRPKGKTRGSSTKLADQED